MAKALRTSNESFYSNPELDEVIRASLVEMDDARRIALMRRAAAIVRDTMALVPLHHEVIVVAVRRGLTTVARGDERIFAADIGRVEFRPVRPERVARLDGQGASVAHGAPWIALMPQLTILTQIGELTVSEEDGAVVALDWGRSRDQAKTPLLLRAARCLQEYFDGAGSAHDLPLAPAGTSFQRRVWAAMRAIPYGESRTYGDLARELGSAARAVGQACGANPIPILIPCHRVIAVSGALGGFSGGEGPVTKQWLLEHERRPGTQTQLPLGIRRASFPGTSAR